MYKITCFVTTGLIQVQGRCYEKFASEDFKILKELSDKIQNYNLSTEGDKGGSVIIDAENENHETLCKENHETLCKDNHETLCRENHETLCKETMVVAQYKSNEAKI